MKLGRLLKDTRIIVGLVFLLALILRLINLSNLPNGFFTDEVVSGYVGRFVLQNGVDPYGNIFPLFYFDKFGDFRVILPMYITGISTFLFGLNEFAVRFPPAFFGALTVIPLYLFVVELTKNRKIAFLSSLFLAILPWHIILSRAQSEGIMGLAVFVAALYFLVKAINRYRLPYLYISLVLFVLTYLFYPNFRLLSPLVVFASAIVLARKKRWRMYIGLGGIVLLVISFIVLQTNWGKGRFEQTSLFGSKEVVRQIESSINAGTSPDPGITVARVFHNKPLMYGRELVVRYFEYFSPQFLFINGGLPYRYAIPNAGLVYVVFVTLLLSFAFSTQESKSKRGLFFLLALLLMAPLPSVVTIDDVPNIHRSLLMTVPIVIMSAFGFVYLYSILPKFRKLFVAGFAFLLFCEMIYVHHQYEFHAETFKSVLRDDQYREVARFIVSEHSNYPKVYAPVYQTLPVYYAYYSNNFDKSLAQKFKFGLVIDQIDNVVFVSEVCPAKKFEKSYYTSGSLIIQSGECESNEGFREVRKFIRRDSTEAFRVLIVD